MVHLTLLLSNDRWGLTTRFLLMSDSCRFFMWGALSDERTGLSFTIAAGTRQGTHSRVRVPWDSRPHITLSDSRLLFSSPPTTRRATVEVFDPASTQNTLLNWTVARKKHSPSIVVEVCLPRHCIATVAVWITYKLSSQLGLCRSSTLLIQIFRLKWV
jgi:hypothetical protein